MLEGNHCSPSSFHFPLELLHEPHVNNLKKRTRNAINKPNIWLPKFNTAQLHVMNLRAMCVTKRNLVKYIFTRRNPKPNSPDSCILDRSIELYKNSWCEKHKAPSILRSALWKSQKSNCDSIFVAPKISSDLQWQLHHFDRRWGFQICDSTAIEEALSSKR